MRNWPRWILGAAASVCFLISLLFTTPMIAGHAHLGIDRAQAIKIAKECLLKNNVKVEPYKITAWLEKALDDDEMQYVFEVAKLRGADKLSASPERPIRWEVRFFQALTPEEYLVSIDQKGNVMSFTVEEPETQPGESISQDKAMERVSKFLRTSHPEVVPFFFEDVTVEKREARIDYGFRFNVPKYKVGDAKYHVLVDCIGGRVSGYDSGWTLPDKWTLEKNIVTMREQICNCINFAFFFICAVGILIWARGVVRTGAISWRPAIVIGLSVTVFYLLSNANECMTFFSSYKNDTPLISYFIDEGVRYLVGAMTTFASATLLSAFGLASLRLLLPDTTVLAVLKSTFIPTSPAETTAHKHLWTDAVLLGYAAAAGDLCLTVLSTGARSLFSPAQLTAPLDIVSRYSNMFDPAIGAFLEAVQRGLFCVFAAAICVGVYARYLRTFKRFALFGLLFGLVMVGSAKYWQNASLDFVGFSLAYLVLWLFIARLAKGNLLAYFLFGYASVFLLSLRVLWHFARALYMQDCAAILVLLLAPAAYAFIRTVGAQPSSE